MEETEVEKIHTRKIRNHEINKIEDEKKKEPRRELKRVI